MSFKKILIPVDGGEVSRHAAEQALELAKLMGAQVATVFAIEPIIGEAGAPPAELAQISEAEDRQILADLQAIIALPADAPHFVHVGHTADVINKTATEWGADLIVIGSHHRGAIGHLLLGSVAEAVVRHAHCPVLVMRGV